MAKVARDDCHGGISGLCCREACGGLPITRKENPIRLSTAVCQDFRHTPKVQRDRNQKGFRAISPQLTIAEVERDTTSFKKRRPALSPRAHPWSLPISQCLVAPSCYPASDATVMVKRLKGNTTSCKVAIELV